MPSTDDFDLERLAHALTPSTDFKSFFQEHAALVSELSGFEIAQLVSSVGGLLATPEFQSATPRIEVLQHLAVASGNGRRKVKSAQLKSWLNRLGSGRAGMMEDPSEDVFASRVLVEDEDCTVFEGIYESSAYHLQRFINILYSMPNGEPYAGLKRATYGLLRLSNEIALRAGVAAYSVGHTKPIRHVTQRTLQYLNSIRSYVTFTAADITSLGTTIDDLATFTFDPVNRNELESQSLGYSSLERSPLIVVEGQVIVALPTAISMAIRRLIIEFCLSADLTDSLYSLISRFDRPKVERERYNSASFAITPDHPGNRVIVALPTVSITS